MLSMSTLSTNDQGKSLWELVYGSVNQVLADHRPAVLYFVVWRSPFPVTLQRIFNTCLQKKFRLMFSAVISKHFSKNHMIISVVAAKIWYLRNVRFLLGHRVLMKILIQASDEQIKTKLLRQFACQNQERQNWQHQNCERRN